MRKIFILITIILSFSLLIGCSENKTPEDTAKKLIDHIKNANLDGCISLFDKDSKNKHDELTDEEKEKEEESIKEYSKRLQNIEILDITENEDKAEVKIEIIFENGDSHTEDISLVKEDNEWRITNVF